jgi:hypothetical protein
LDHGHDVIKKLNTYLVHAASTKSEIVRITNLWLCDTALHWLQTFYDRFELAEKRSKDEKWMALCGFISYYAMEFKLHSLPMPLLGDSYYSTGSFEYYKKLSLRLSKEYYLVSVDSSDPPVFWPLAVHELCHCWLSSSSVVDSIYGTHANEFNGISHDIAESRIEETLCDSLATYLIGPAYPYAYIHKLWAQFPIKTSEYYPSNEYRIECMASILDELQLNNIASEIRLLAKQRFNNSWEEEEIACVTSDLAQYAQELTRNIPQVSTQVCSEARKASKVLKDSPPENLSTLFLSCWMLIDETRPELLPASLNFTTEVLLKSLKGRSGTPNA